MAQTLIAEIGPQVLQAVLTLGVAYGGVKAAMNGIKESQARIEAKLDKVTEKVDYHGNRLTALEVLNTKESQVQIENNRSV